MKMPKHSIDHDYRPIHDFVNAFREQGFEGIRREDPLVVDLEARLRARRQYLHIADLLRMEVLFASSSVRDLFGLEPDAVHMGTFFARTHPDDRDRHSLVRSKTLHAAQNLLIHKAGVTVHSTEFRQPDASGTYMDVLFQAYLFCSEKPTSTVYMALVLSDLSGFTADRTGHHYYLGNDLTCFRYPDMELLLMGHHFTDREFEILTLIAEGLDTGRIAKQLMLSVNTVNTHRRNIVRKSGKSSTHELVMELREMGVL